MDRDKLFNKLTYKNVSDNDELGMILSNNIDTGHEDGGLISVKQFDQLIGDIKQWRANKNWALGLYRTE
jgi:hypothetical protein